MSSRDIVAAAVYLLILTAVCLPAQAQFLYGVDSFQGSGSSSVYQINPATGQINHAATMTGVNRTAFSGADVLNNDKFFASNASINSVGPLRVADVNPVSGVSTSISTQDGMINWQGLAAADSGLLYATNGFSPNVNELFHLFSLDPATGVIADIGSVGTTMTGLAYDNNTDTLYGISQVGHLFSIDTGTAATTFIGNTGIVPTATIANLGMAIDSDTGTFYVTYAAETFSPTTLHRFTLATVTTPTTVASLTYGGSPVLGMFGLGFSATAIPEPTTIALLGIGSVPLLRRRRRRSQSY